MEETAVPYAVIHDPLKAYHYFKSHYWDRFNLTDDRLLRSPVFHPRLDYYFKQLVPPVPDSVIRAIDKLILLTGDNIEFRDYLIWHFTSEYQNSTIMGMDKVFVHMADNYFSKTTVTNTSASVLEKIKERADQLRKLMIGVSAPDIWLIDTSGNYRSFREIKKEFTVLFFWDFDCGVCIKEMDALVKLHNSQTYDMEVFAIGTNSNLEGWKDNVIRKKLSWINVNGTRSLNADFHDLYDIYGTPVIYLLDKEKKIIAKRIKAEQISLVIDNYRLTLNKN
jgi:thiol-disulfide isomerase/thioredoxin